MGNLKANFGVLSLLLITGLIGRTKSNPVETPKVDEPQSLAQFRSMVSDKVTEDFMKEDWYLKKWIEARNFNLPEAERMLLDVRLNKIATIFSSVYKCFHSAFAKCVF